MKRRKQLLCALLATSMLVATACGSKGSEGTSENKGTDGVEQITLWHPADSEAVDQWYTEMVDAFNEEYKGKYELSRESIVRADSFAYEDKVNAAITSNTLPDVLMIDGPYVSSYAANDIIIPLDDYFDDEYKANILDSTMQQNTYDDKMYAVGLAESSVALFYNKDMLASIGEEAPTSIEDAWTWEEWYEIAKKLTTDEVAGATIIMDKGEGLIYVMEQFWLSNGTDVISADGTTADGYINSKEGVEAAEFLKKFIDEGIANIDPIPNEFGEGKSATCLGGCWDVATLENSYPDLNWGVTYFPVAENGKATSPTGDWTYSITKNAKDPEAAAAVIEFLTRDENLVKYAEAYMMPPATKSAFEACGIYDEGANALFKEQLYTTGTARPRTPVYPTLTARFAESMINIFTGADVQEELDSVAEKVDQEYESTYAE